MLIDSLLKRRVTHKLVSNSLSMFISNLFSPELSFYGQFGLMINYIETKEEGFTCAVTSNNEGLVFYYSVEFLSSLNTVYGELPLGGELERERQINFIFIHEYLHLILNHLARLEGSGYDHSLSNIVMDAVINSTIISKYKGLLGKKLSTPKYSTNEKNDLLGLSGKNSAIFIPIEYKGKDTFEELYDWYFRMYREWEEKGKPLPPQGEEYGPYGRDIDGGIVETFALEDIFNRMENDDEGNGGMFLDKHLNGKLPAEYTEKLVESIIDNIRKRGYLPGSIDMLMKVHRKERKDYLRQIKRYTTNYLLGDSDTVKTYNKINRRDPELKGKYKTMSSINVIWDTSGSMNGLHEKVLAYIYKKDVLINLIPIDTKVTKHQVVKKRQDFNRIQYKGGGGTVLQPAVDYCLSEPTLKKNNILILTDGMTDTINLTGVRKTVIITTSQEVPLMNKSNNVKQIVIKK